MHDNSFVLKGTLEIIKKEKSLKLKIKDNKNLFIIHAGTKLYNRDIYSLEKSLNIVSRFKIIIKLEKLLN